MNDDRSLLGGHPLPERADEPHQGLRRFRNAKVRPSREVKVPDGPDGVASHHTELGDVPVRKQALVHDGDLDVSVVNGLSVVRPVPVALFSPFLHAAGQHDDGPGVGLPTHAPEVVAGGMQRSLSYDEFAGGVVTGNKVGVDEIGPFLVVRRLQLDARMVVWQNVGESVLGTVDRHVGCRAWLFASDMLQFLVFLGETEVRVGRHDAVVFSEVFEFDRLGRLDDGVRQGNVVSAVPQVTSGHAPHFHATRSVCIGGVIVFVSHSGKQNGSVNSCLQ